MKKTRKTAKAKPRRHGWQVVAFVPWRDEPTNFDSEYAYPTIYLNEVLAEHDRRFAERNFLRDVMPDIADHVDAWNYEDEVADTLLTKLAVPQQRAFIRAFLPKLWADRNRSWLTISDDAVREAFRKERFAAPGRAPALAWETAARLLDAYVPMPILRKVRLVP